MRCPYNKKVICEYLASGSSTVYECDECPHFRPNLNLGSPRSSLGCLFITIVILIGFLFTAALVIKSLRPETPKSYEKVIHSK